MRVIDFELPKPSSEATLVNLDDIVVDKEYQMRTELIDESTVEEYARLMQDGGVFPPLVAFRLPDSRLVLVDGYQRYHAARDVGKKAMFVDVHEGTASDALRYAALVDNKTGLPRSNGDKRRAATALLKLSPASSNRSLAVCLGVSPTFIGNIRRELEEAGNIAAHDTTVGRNGVSQRRQHSLGANGVHQGEQEPESKATDREKLNGLSAKEIGTQNEAAVAVQTTTPPSAASKTELWGTETKTDLLPPKCCLSGYLNALDS